MLELGIAVCGVLVLARLPSDRSRLRGRRRARAAGHAAARLHLRHLPAAAHGADGRVPAGHRALDRIHAARRVLVGAALWRQHRGRGVRLPAGGLLPAAHLQHGHRHLRGRGHQPGGGGGQLRGLAARTPAGPADRQMPRRFPAGRSRQAAGRSTSPSRFRAPARWARKWSGRA